MSQFRTVRELSAGLSDRNVIVLWHAWSFRSTPTLSSLISIFRAEEAAGDIIFVHGLGGDPKATWGFDQSYGWDTWLKANRPDLNVWSIQYRVEPSEWRGGAMPLSDRALNLLALLDNQALGSRPLVFVAHSMGGLLVKEMLRHALTVTARFRHVVERTKAIIFFSTPHTGSSLADIAIFFGFFVRESAATTELAAQQPRLRDLNLWFRNNFSSLGIDCCIFYETQDTLGVRVVNEASADPGIASVSPIPIDANHSNIARPPAYGDIAVGQTLKIIDASIPSDHHKFDPNRYFAINRPINILTSRRLPRIYIPNVRRSTALGVTASIAILAAAATWAYYSPAYCRYLWPSSYCAHYDALSSYIRIADTVTISQNIGDPIVIFGFQLKQNPALAYKVIFEAIYLTMPDGTELKFFPAVVQRDNQPFMHYPMGIPLDSERIGSEYVIMFSDDRFKKWATLGQLAQNYGPSWWFSCAQSDGISMDIAEVLIKYFDNAFSWQSGEYTMAATYRINGGDASRIFRSFSITKKNVEKLREIRSKLKRCAGVMIDGSQIGNLSFIDTDSENFVSVTAPTKF